MYGEGTQGLHLAAENDARASELAALRSSGIARLHLFVIPLRASPAKIVRGLQVEPETGFHAKVSFQPQSGVGSHRTSASDQLGDAIVRHAQSTSQLPGGQPKGHHE